MNKRHSHLKVLGIWFFILTLSIVLSRLLPSESIVYFFMTNIILQAIAPLVFAYALTGVRWLNTLPKLFLVQLVSTILWAVYLRFAMFGFSTFDTPGLVIYIAAVIIAICIMNLVQMVKKHSVDSKGDGIIEDDESVIKQQNPYRRIAILAVVVVTVATFIFMTFSGVTYESIRAREFLSDLPRKELSHQEIVQTVHNLQRFRVNGQESSNDWITTNDRNFEVVGAILPFSDTIRADRQTLSLSVVAVPETVSGVTVFHLLPLVVTSDTEQRTFGESKTSLYRVEFSMQDRWLHAEIIEETNRQKAEDEIWKKLPNVEVSFWQLYYDERTYFPLRTVWLDIADGKRFTFDDFESGGAAGFSEYPNVYYMATSNRLGSAIIFHSFQVHRKSEGKLPCSFWAFDAPITLQSNRFVFVE